jgi:signal transduction histidine kinase
MQLFLGFLAFFLLSINDALLYHSAIDSIYLMPAGLFIVTFSQAYVLAQKSSSGYLKADKLAAELQGYVNNLEEIIAERTYEIQQQNKEIENQKANIEQVAEELQLTNENLIKLAEFKKNMTHMMVHDLKNPLNNIIGFSELPGDINNFKSHIHTSGWNMLNLVQNILDVEQSESSEITINKKPFNLNKLVNESYNNTEYMFKSKAMTFESQIAKDLNLIADENLVKRVFTNILSNATKYALENCFVKVSSEYLKLDNQREFVKISIYNNGPAIPEEKHKSIFDKYNRLSEDGTNNFHSSGIGLAFCKLAITGHGGDIGVISGKVKGVTFWFTLPVS